MKIKISLWIRLWLIIRRSPILYRLYLLVNGYWSVAAYPSLHSDLFITGYQRSGNSYSAKLIRKLFPELRLASHIHTVAAIRSAFKLNVPVLVLIRDPHNSVTSSIVQQVVRKRSMGVAMKSLNEYCDFYRFLLSYKDQLNFVVFDLVKNKPEVLVSTVRRLVPHLDKITDVEVNLASEQVIAGIKSHQVAPQEYGWKSEEKEKSKAIVLDFLLGSDELSEAQFLFHQLMSYISSKVEKVV